MHTIESLQPYLTRIAHNIVRTYHREQDPDDLLQIMNLHIVEAAQADPEFLNQNRSYICKVAAYRARNFCNRESYGERKQPKLIDRDDEGLLAERFAAPQVDQDIVLDVRKALQTLSGRTAEIAQLMLDGWRQADIAKHFGITRQSVQPEKKRIEAALAPVYEAVRG